MARTAPRWARRLRCPQNTGRWWRSTTARWGRNRNSGQWAVGSGQWAVGRVRGACALPTVVLQGMKTRSLRPTLNRYLHRCALLIVAAAGTMTGCSDSAAKESRDDAVVQALQTMVRNGRGFPGTRPGAEELTRLRRLYETSGYTPLWINLSGDLRKSGKEALDRLRNAESEGLRPADYVAVSMDS